MPLTPRSAPALLAAAALAAVLPLVPLGAQPAPAAPTPADPKLAALLEPIRAKHRVPALWGGVVRGDRLVAVAAVGVRKDGEAAPVTVDDRVHIGSDTKAMTATLIGLLIEEKKLTLATTVVEVFPDLKAAMHADYHAVTVGQLLDHTAGLPANVPWLLAQGGTPQAARRAVLPLIFKDAPAAKPGTKFGYSNCGYVVAGAVAEQVTDRAWEDLTRDRLFRPLGITTGGFGAPGTPGGLDQPWGHRLAGEKRTAVQADNLPVMGPAGRVHLSVPDWAKFVGLHLGGARGKAGLLLTPETFKRLHTPAEGFAYAGGWGVGKGGTLSHDGSNTMWHARARVMPGRGVALLVATNQGGDAAREAVADAARALDGYSADRPEPK